MTKRQLEEIIRKEVRRNLNEGMSVKASVVIMSHLSDIQEMFSSKQLNDKINFAKFLLIKYPNVSTSIDPDEEYQEFKNKFKNR